MLSVPAPGKRFAFVAKHSLPGSATSCRTPAESSEAMIARISRALGRDLKAQPMPAFLLGALGLFVPILRELGEMGYQWNESFVMNDARFRARFGLAPTSFDDGVPRLVEWAKGHYAAKH